MASLRQRQVNPVSTSVAFGGSRSLSSSLLCSRVSSVVGAVLASGASVSVGCCVGADAQVVSSVLAAGAASRLSVFSAFGPGGVGSCSVSAVSGVLAVSAAGGRVAWWSGGGPAVPLAARLARRSAACAQSVAPAGAGVLLWPGAGSLAAFAPAALAAGLPLFAFAPCAPLAVPGCVGGWAASSFVGFSCWAWLPGQPSLF